MTPHFDGPQVPPELMGDMFKGLTKKSPLLV
jgi:hypothetical protein